MRLFLMDYEYTMTESDVYMSYLESEDYTEYKTPFPVYLADCLSKNGALTEILTKDTPKENRRSAVSLCCVLHRDDDDLSDIRYLTYYEIKNQISYGNKILAVLSNKLFSD